MPGWVLRVLAALRSVPWSRVLAAIAWLNTAGRRYWDRLTPAERREVLDLAAKSKGRRSNLTKKEQDRLVELLRKIRQPPPEEEKK
jgi:hypothetical protein